MNTVIIGVDLQQALIMYLKDKAYEDVAPLIQGLAQAQPSAPELVEEPEVS